VAQPLLARELTVKDAPLEWLITQTILLKTQESQEHFEQDDLFKEIFQTIKYNTDLDEMVLHSSEKTNTLKLKLIDYLEAKTSTKSADPLYNNWKQEQPAPYEVEITENITPENGFYVFNHVHTNISQDNRELKWLKLSPQKTFSIIEGFLSKRDSTGVVNFCDHDTDRAFDLVSSIESENLIPLRSIEWGGRTHMNLVDIKENWDLIDQGREYAGEESIIMSRSSQGFRIINHPNGGDPAFPYTSWLDADGVEVWNTVLENSPYKVISKFNPSNNRQALKQWSDSLKIGKRHTAMAGSDFHFIIPCLRDRTLFYPANYIPGDNSANVRANLFNGNVSFLTGPTAPKLNLKAKFASDRDWAKMGSTLNGTGELVVAIEADLRDSNKLLKSACYNTINAFFNVLTFWKKRRWEIRFYNLAGEVLAKKELNARKLNHDDSFSATIRIPITGTQIVRAELWEINRKAESVDLLSATNPVYINW
tara:strand:+ start:7483 stop:8922 length:1440 start_codon:yes stop_codon:yes gene_type:complete